MGKSILVSRIAPCHLWHCWANWMTVTSTNKALWTSWGGTLFYYTTLFFIFYRCRNFDGGFGAVPGAESHAGQIFCCVGALSIGGALDQVDENLLGWWLSERQCDSGGLNGRPEKQADVCYSWWILSCLRILGRV